MSVDDVLSQFGEDGPKTL